MKALKLALVLAFVLPVAFGFGCGGGGGGGASFDDCVTAGMDQIKRQTGAEQAAAKGTIEMACQVCKEKPGSDPCNMIVDAYKK